jgi:hypothetical protein
MKPFAGLLLDHTRPVFAARIGFPFRWSKRVTGSWCWAWGATGHESISGIAIQKLPDSVPAFVRAPEANAEIAVMGPELYRSKGAGEPHDKERDPGHYRVALTAHESPRIYKRHGAPACGPASVQKPLLLQFTAV